jgi:hypothetical protein
MDLQMFQTNSLMFPLFILSLRWLDRRPFLAGVPLGFIFNIKYLSLALLPWLIVRRRWGTAVAFVLSAIFFALLPAIISGWTENLRGLQVAYGGLLHMVGVSQGTEQANVEDIKAGFSCSITSAMARLTLLGPSMPMAMGYVAMIALLTLAVVVLLYRREKIPLFAWPSPSKQASQPWRAIIALEFTALVAATLCFSPQTNTKHLLLAGLVTLPAAVLLLTAKRGVPRYIAAVGMMILVLGFAFPRNDQHGTQTMWIAVGGLCWCLLIALLTLLSVGLMNAKKAVESR